MGKECTKIALFVIISANNEDMKTTIGIRKKGLYIVYICGLHVSYQTNIFRDINGQK